MAIKKTSQHHFYIGTDYPGNLNLCSWATGTLSFFSEKSTLSFSPFKRELCFEWQFILPPTEVKTMFWLTVLARSGGMWESLFLDNLSEALAVTHHQSNHWGEASLHPQCAPVRAASFLCLLPPTPPWLSPGTWKSYPLLETRTVGQKCPVWQISIFARGGWGGVMALS